MEERKINSLYCRTCSIKEPFRIHFSLYFKAALCANSFFKKISFHSYRRKELMTLKKNFVLRLALKKRLIGARKSYRLSPVGESANNFVGF